MCTGRRASSAPRTNWEESFQCALGGELPVLLECTGRRASSAPRTNWEESFQCALGGELPVLLECTGRRASSAPRTQWKVSTRTFPPLVCSMQIQRGKGWEIWSCVMTSDKWMADTRRVVPNEESRCLFVYCLSGLDAFARQTVNTVHCSQGRGGKHAV